MSLQTVVEILILALSFLVSMVKNEAGSRSIDQMEIEMNRAQIIPDILRIAPRYELKVRYENATVSFGNKLTPFEFQTEPLQVYWPTKNNTLYTIIFTDPDVPSRQNPEDREWMHWIVSNIPKTHINKGDVLATYIGPVPAQLGSWHRYVFLVFEQKKREEFRDWMHRDWRPIKKYRAKFSTSHFVSKYGLGDIVAANYFLSSNDTITTTTAATLPMETTEYALEKDDDVWVLSSDEYETPEPTGWVVPRVITEIKRLFLTSPLPPSNTSQTPEQSTPSPTAHPTTSHPPHTSELHTSEHHTSEHPPTVKPQHN